MNRTPHIIALKGNSNSGKTTSLESIVEFLTNSGKKASIIKHIHRDNFSIDQKGKDTWKMRQAGGDPIISYSKDEIAFLTNKKLDINQTIQIVTKIQDDVDYIFLEGFWENLYPKILFFKDLNDLEQLLLHILKSPIGSDILSTTFCLSGVYFALSTYSIKEFSEKISQLCDNEIINTVQKTHLLSLPTLNIKDHPKNFLEIYKSRSIIKENV